MAFQIATICVSGDRIEKASENPKRIRLLNDVVQEIHKHKWSPDIILFPGGYFFLPKHIGPLEYNERVSEISNQGFSRACRNAAKILGTTVVVGVDSIEWKRGNWHVSDYGDQLCVAWDARGISGVGRKVFPTKSEANRFVVYANDFATKRRIAPLKGRASALLCSCYDTFGCRKHVEAIKRSKNIRWLGEGKAKLLGRGEKGQRKDLNASVEIKLPNWESLLRKATVGLVSIHGFERKAGKGYWQKYGIENASKVVGGGIFFGAGHWLPPLPKPNVTVLAAKNGNALKPQEHFYWPIKHSEVLVRLYKQNSIRV